MYIPNSHLSPEIFCDDYKFDEHIVNSETL